MKSIYAMHWASTCLLRIEMMWTAKPILLPLATALSVVCVLTGCQSPKPSSPGRSSAERSTRNNCYSLLHQLLSEQKKVSLLRFIKREHPDVKALIQKIAAQSAAGAKLLEDFAKRDPSIVLTDIQLPLGEERTRDAIASTKKKELLSQTGDSFEVTLLLSQAEALSYAWHLAKVAGETESDPNRIQALAGVSENFKNLYHEVFAMLLSKARDLPRTTWSRKADVLRVPV